MFEWIKDMNWPGAFDIYARIKRMNVDCIMEQRSPKKQRSFKYQRSLKERWTFVRLLSGAFTRHIACFRSDR